MHELPQPTRELRLQHAEPKLVQLAVPTIVAVGRDEPCRNEEKRRAEHRSDTTDDVTHRPCGRRRRVEEALHASGEKRGRPHGEQGDVAPRQQRQVREPREHDQVGHVESHRRSGGHGRRGRPLRATALGPGGGPGRLAPPDDRQEGGRQDHDDARDEEHLIERDGERRKVAIPRRPELADASEDGVVAAHARHEEEREHHPFDPERTDGGDENGGDPGDDDATGDLRIVRHSPGRGHHAERRREHGAELADDHDDADTEEAVHVRPDEHDGDEPPEPVRVTRPTGRVDPEHQLKAEEGGHLGPDREAILRGDDDPRPEQRDDQRRCPASHREQHDENRRQVRQHRRHDEGARTPDPM